MLRLPKSDLSPEQLSAVEAYFQRDLRSVWENSTARISYVAFDLGLQEGLKSTLRTGCLSQGLEPIAKLLNDEKKGLVAVQSRTGQVPVDRMSRLLFITNDGSERFYRQISSLISAHGNRVWAARVDTTSEAMGALLARGPAKAILINDKKALAGFLAALARNLF